MLLKNTRNIIATGFVFAILAVVLYSGGFMSQAANPETSKINSQVKGAVVTRSDDSGMPWLKLQNGYESNAIYKNAENGSQLGALDPSAKSLSLFSADLNSDGFPDLASGYTVSEGGIISLRFGDPEAFGPTLPETIEGIKNGVFPATFKSDAVVLKVPERPDFLSVGDFDRDGSLDILTAARGSSEIYVLSQNSEKHFINQRKLILPGQITTLATGRDVTSPYLDLAVGVNTEAGARVVFYATRKSVFEEIPAVYQVPTEVVSIAVGQLDENIQTDLAVATKTELLVIHGSDGKSPEKLSKEGFFQSQIERIEMTDTPLSLAIGNFVPDRADRMEIAVLTNGGTVLVKGRGQLNLTPYTKEEIFAKRQNMAEMRRTGNFGKADTSAWNPATAETWSDVQNLYVNTFAAGQENVGQVLMSGNIAASGGDELIVINSGNRQIEILLNDSDPMTGNIVSLERSSFKVDFEGIPVAALPMRTGVIGMPGIVFLTEEKVAPVVMTAVPQATFDVDRTDDVAASTACTAAPTDCSLRGAVLASNANGVSSDMVTFTANTPTLTVVGNDNSGNGGDLDINGNLTVLGNGSGSTILSTTYTASGTNDHKIFGVNQDGFFNSLAVSFSGVTIQNGFNRAPCGSFLDTGGGGDFFLTSTGNSHSITNSIIRNNNADLCTTSHGGGINIDSSGSASVGGPNLGTVNITNSTFSGNTSDAEGGGLNAAADKHDVVITNSVFGGANPVDGNQTELASMGNGAGIDIEHSFGGTVTINGGSVQNNTAARTGGGITVTFNTNFSLNGTSISNNTSNSSGSGSSAGGGVVISPTGVLGFTPTLSLSSCTISNNIATNGAAGQGGGLYFNSPYSATVSNCAIGGNSADRGAGVFNGGSSATPAATLTIDSGTIISGNTASGPGGGVANVDSNGAVTVLNGITISSNSSGSGGDGIDQTLEGGGTGSTMTLQGTINVNGGDSIFIGRGTFGSTSGTLNLTGNFTRDSTSTFNANGGTVNFNGTGTQAIGGTGATTFNNLTVANTSQPLAVNTNTNANGNLTINSNAILNPAAGVLIGGTGTLTGNGFARVTRIAATPDFLSQYTITNKTLTNLTVDYAGSAAQTVSAISYGGLRLNNTSGASLASGTTTVNAALTLAAGNLAVGTNTLVLNNGSTISGGTFSSSATGTVSYNQGSDGQSVLAGNYGNLTFSNFNKTLPAATVGIAGTFSTGTANAHVVTGNTINFNGAGAQTVPTFTYNNLTTSTSGVKTTGMTVNVNGNATVGAGTTLSIASGSTFTVAGSLTNNSIIQGTGTIVNTLFDNTGTLNPGTSPGILNINGNFRNSNIINMEIGGTGGAGVDPNGHDQILVNANANLGGTLNVALTNGFTPSPGDSFLLLDAASIVNFFSAINLPNIFPNQWSVIYDNPNGTFTLNVVAPTAAAVSVSGRIISPEGRGISRAQVVVTNSNGESRMVTSNSFGYYRINDLPVGETYVFSVSSKQYTFAPRVVALNEETTGFDFQAEP